jgi:hypothetical protein
MKPVCLFVEGKLDDEFLRRVLPAELVKETGIVQGGSRAGMASLARSFLVRRRTPLAVVMDADSLNPTVMEKRRESMEELIQAAAGSIPVKVVLTVPEIEAWFFTVPEVIERVLGEKPPDDLLALGPRDPNRVLEQLSRRRKSEWDSIQAIRALTGPEIERIRARPDVTELTQFLQKVLSEHQAA